MKTPTGSNYRQSPQPNYPPSVPLYVYRELTKELQAIQAKLDAVTSQNQKLAQENKLLKQEFNQVVQSCLELQKLLNSSQTTSQATSSVSQSIPRVSYNSQLLDDPVINSNIHPEIKYSIPTPAPSPVGSDVNNHAKTRSKPPVKPLTPPTSVKKVKPPQKRRKVSPAPAMDVNFPISETVFIEEEKASNTSESESLGLNSWWLVLIIIVIMITGFSAGYLVVRPFLQTQNQSK